MTPTPPATTPPERALAFEPIRVADVLPAASAAHAREGRVDTVRLAWDPAAARALERWCANHAAAPGLACAGAVRLALEALVGIAASPAATGSEWLVALAREAPPSTEGVVLEVGSGDDTRVVWHASPAPVTDVPQGGFVAERPDPDSIALHFRRDDFHPDGVAVLASRWLQVLANLAEAPDRSVADLTALPAAELDTLRRLAHPQAWSYTGPRNLSESWARSVAAHGPRVALAWADGTLTYAELDACAARLAARLDTLGVRPGDAVGMVMDRGPQAVIAQLAILRCAAAYAPLDPGFPPERLAASLSDIGCRHVLHAASAVPELPPAFECIDVSEAHRPTADTPVGPAPTPTADDAPAYVMFTSGSTGRPKGVEVPHAAVVRLVKAARYMRLDETVRMLHAAPLGFDASTLEIWGPLLNGGCCVIHDERVPTGAGLARAIARHRVDTLWLTAALFNAVVDEDPHHLRGLKQLLTGGEALSPSHVARALDALPGTTLINGYGPTETTTFATTHTVTRADLDAAHGIPIGRPITATTAWVLDAHGQATPAGLVGELCLGGLGLALGYRGRPDLTAERFVTGPAFTGGERLYRTGDRVRWTADGTLEYFGRRDGQVKVRGLRIEFGEIEAALQAHPDVRSCAVALHHDEARGPELVAYLVPSTADGVDPAALRAHLSRTLPAFMVPAHCVSLPALPRTPNGKLDRRALPPPSTHRPEGLAQPYTAPEAGLERQIAEAFARTLGLDPGSVGALDNFFDLGGNSLLALRALAALREAGLGEWPATALFETPTPRALGARATRDAHAPVPPTRHAGRAPAPEPIAIVGMACRLPGANSVEALWALLLEGREGLRRFAPEDLDPSIPQALRTDPAYVPVRGVIDGADRFDAEFFGITAREAELMDPQQRVFLELCWECLERAGHVPERQPGPVGVFAGMYNASYFQKHVLAHPDRVERFGEFQTMLGNEKDYIATRTAFKLNLTGPAISVHTACSTSLVAIAQAFESLAAGQCRMALAGGSSITCPTASGYLYQEGSMLSPDGHTRTFDAEANGTVFCDGAAVVLLKRLSDAQADGDTIHAVIRGVAVNNDGADKASFTAPGVDGQTAVIASALARAQVPARSIDYVETHGTATPLGDPVEITALTRAFRADTPDQGFCAVGSIKSNIGHAVIAAGAAGVIKTALSLAAELRPGNANFTRPNPKIPFEGSPFFVQAQAQAWPRRDTPRRAGVSAFGVGGTNAHVILEEAPVAVRSPETAESATGPHVLRLSARTPDALRVACRQLADHLEAHPGTDLADAAYTLEVGRRGFAHRTAVAGMDASTLAAALREQSTVARPATVPSARPALALVFPGQGSQYPRMGLGLRESDPAFRAAFDAAIEAVRVRGGVDLRDALASSDEAALQPTAFTQPATLCVEYALARAWQARGIEPGLLIGHSVGEFAAAVIADVMTLDDAAGLVARRGALMQALPGGGMLSVRLPAAELLPLLPPDIQLAGENGPSATVVAGPHDALARLCAALEPRGIAHRLLKTSHAFHSAMMDPAVPEFEALVRTVRLSPPRRRIASTLTGRWLTDAEATDPGYWARHLREPVRFASAVATVLEAGPTLFLEGGPRSTLATLVRQHRSPHLVAAVPSLDDHADTEALAMAGATGALWSWGLEPHPVGAPAPRRRIVLPTYPFERKRHWLDARPDAPAASVTPLPLPAAAPPADAPLPNAMTPTSAPPSRLPALVQRLRVLFEDVSGVALDDADPDASFVELGLDSLTLTQVALKLKREFSLNITFRQLMERQPTLGTLAAYLDETLPADPESVAIAPSVAAPTAPPAPAVAMASTAPAMLAAAPLAGQASLPMMAQLMQQQLQLMQLMTQQLIVASTAAPAPAPAAPAVLATPTPPVPAPAPSAAPSESDETAALAHTRYNVNKAFGAIARIHSQGTELTARQQARLDTFMRRYIERTRRSKDYTVAHRRHLADPRVVNGFRPALKEIIYQIVIERSKGARMWDLDGNEYVDALNGFGMSLFGWQPDFVVDAVRRQLDSGYDIGPMHPLAGEVARLVCTLTGFDRAGLCNTGSEAVMGCVRIARTITGRDTIVMFTGAYHGIFDEVIVRGTRSGKAVPAAPGILPNTAEHVVVLDYGTPESLQWIREHADELAAVLVEPVQSRRPDFRPVEFLKDLRAVTEASGALLIFDEVVTGFRSHPGGIQALFGIRADLASYGKVVGGGFPIGIIAGKREYMDALDGGHWDYGDDSVPTVGVTYFAGTFVRHPLALVAAHAVLEHLAAEGPALQEALTRTTTEMVDELNAHCRRVGAPIVLKSFASVWKVFFDEDHPLQDLLFAMMRSRGVHILDNFPCFMTTAHTEADIALIKTAFKDAVAELQEAEFIPRRAPAAIVFDASKPPRPGARLGRDPDGNPAWYVANPEAPGKYLKVE